MEALDRAGDYTDAVAVAQRCMQLGASIREVYYGPALASARGVARNGPEAFRLLSKTGYALDMAQLYYEGIGVARDPVEASVLAWAASHNAAWDFCTDDRGCFTGAYALSAQIDRELSPSQKARAREIESERYPDKVRQQNVS
jgi:hypothetical protein